VRDVVVVAGSVAQRPGRGGHAWVFLQYLLGFRRLGYDVLFVDRISSEMLEPGAEWPPTEASAWLHGSMAAVGLEDSYSLLLDGPGVREAVGVPREQVMEQLRRSVLLVDVMGFLEDEELLGAAGRTLFLDIDPGFPQMWRELGLHDSFGRHDAYATVGLRVGEEGCTVPDCGIDWIRTPQPVVLDEWLPAGDPGEAYTSVVTWRGPFGPVDFAGERYGLRAHQMRRFTDLPTAVGVPLEVALEIDPADATDADALRGGGWRLVAPDRVAGTVGGYRDYVRRSKGEIGVAKDMYVRSRGGWLSDRSLCYLAAGRPVIAQATGFELEVETGEGLIAFDTPEAAAAAIERVEADYARHSSAARELAAERFGSDRVLRDLLEAAT
jgi:glycosyltransferase involved in cell wall biosynthesis